MENGAADSTRSRGPLRPSAEAIDKLAKKVEERVITWRRDIHQHPELSNREHRTASIVAEHLKALDIETQTGIAHTGVVGVLRGSQPGPVVALRADMDALPVTEEVDLAFASKVRTMYNGQEVDVMHACGHDAHTAVLMGTAEVLAGLRDQLAGTVKFVFQPAEESPPKGEDGGAPMMIAEGVLENPEPDAIFGFHVAAIPTGIIAYRPMAAMASQDDMRITVRGRQTHGALPWLGIDPIVVASQIVLALQTITSRQVDVTTPAVVSIGTFHAGVRDTIIPDEAVLTGTIRAMESLMREDIHRRVRRTVEHIARSAGATATVVIEPELPLTFNDPDLTARMVPTLERIVGSSMLIESPPIMGSEDFAYYQQRIPGLIFFIGVNHDGVSMTDAAPTHSPRFQVNEDALIIGVRAMANLAVDYLMPTGE